MPLCLQELAEQKKAKTARRALCSCLSAIQEENPGQVQEMERLHVEIDRLKVASQKPNNSELKAMANNLTTPSSASSSSSHSNSSSSGTLEPKALASKHISFPS